MKILVGNKIDMERKVDRERADSWARSHGMLFLEASAKTRLGIKQVFWIGYGFMIFLISIIFYGIFISPAGFKKLLVFVFQLPFLKRWNQSAIETGNEVIATSKELRGSTTPQLQTR